LQQSLYIITQSFNTHIETVIKKPLNLC